MTELQPVGREVHAGASIRRERVAAGLTLRQLAEHVGVSVGTMSAIENAKVALTVGRLQEVAEALGVAAPRLLAAPVEPLGPLAPRSGGAEGDWRSFAPLPAGNPVLSAAVAVFRETGYHGATMRMIAAAADISVPGIYHHYRSKQGLLVALVDLVMDDLGWRVARAAEDGVDAQDAPGGVTGPAASFALMVEALALFHAVRGDEAFIVATEARSLDEPDRRRVAAVRRRLQTALDLAAQQAVEDGTFAVAVPRDVARAVATMCMALPHWYAASGARAPGVIAREYADLALDMMRVVRP